MTECIEGVGHHIISFCMSKIKSEKRKLKKSFPMCRNIHKHTTLTQRQRYIYIVMQICETN